MSRAERIAALKAASKERVLILDGSWGVMFQKRGLSELQCVGHLQARPPSVHGDQDGVQTRRRPEELNPLGTVSGTDCDPVARTDAVPGLKRGSDRSSLPLAVQLSATPPQNTTRVVSHFLADRSTPFITGTSAWRAPRNGQASTSTLAARPSTPRRSRG